MNFISVSMPLNRYLRQLSFLAHFYKVKECLCCTPGMPVCTCMPVCVNMHGLLGSVFSSSEHAHGELLGSFDVPHPSYLCHVGSKTRSLGQSQKNLMNTLERTVLIQSS